MKLTLVVLSVMVIALAQFRAEVNAAPKRGGGKIPVGSIAGALGGAAAVVGAAGAGGNLQQRSIDFDSSVRGEVQRVFVGCEEHKKIAVQQL